MGILKRWNLKEIEKSSETQRSLEDDLSSFPKSFQTILNLRDIHDLHSFYEYTNLDISMLNDPFLLPDMEIAIERIKSAIADKELIYVYGDYDTDGITSSALMIKTLKFLGADVNYYLPDRFEEGYGLNKDGLTKIMQSGAKLVISVDCGIVSVEEALFAQEIGLDLIITDHHNPQEEIPKAIAVIDPKLSYCKYPFRELAGVGVAFKIATALLGERLPILMDELLLLASIGTVADLVPMVGENRVIVKEGLSRYARGLNYGVDALIDVSKINANALSPDDIGFSLSPRLNSSGRLAHASVGLELLLCDEYEIAYDIADELNKLNSQRQYKTAQIVKNAIAMIEENPLCLHDKIIIVWGEDWHEGVLGIVASKLVEKYSRPAIVLCLKDGVLKGSARSVKGFSIFDCIYSVSDMLIKFGGHNQAAGLSLRVEFLDYFIEMIRSYCEEHLSANMLIPSIDIDVEISMREITLDYFYRMMKLYPFGVGNKLPVFVARNVNINEFRMVGKSQNHLKFSTYNHGIQIGGIKFFYEDYMPHGFGDFRADIVFELSENYFNGVNQVQLKLFDIRFYDPDSSDFAKRAFALYNIALFKLLKIHDEAMALQSNFDHGIKCFLNDVNLVSKEYRMRQHAQIEQMIKHRNDIVITSYEAFLELLYLLYDLNYIDNDPDESFFEEFDFIKLLPCDFDVIKKADMIDFPLFYIGMQTHFDNVFDFDILSRSFDNDFLFRLLQNMKFDRNRSIELYMKIKKQGKLSIYQEFINSDNILNDMIIWSFFEEANFITSDDLNFQLVKGNHQHYDFKNSKIDKKINNLLISRRIKTWI